MLIRDRASNHLVIDTPAKINLFLQVLGKREDGFHNIHSAFQAISLFDRLEIRLSGSKGINLKITGDFSLKPDPNNLVYRTYELMVDRFNLTQGLEVQLHKKIPIAAGLGGGSADGAAMILACNVLFNIALDYKQMAQLSLELGSDLPFFFSGGQALVSGRGEIIRPIELPLDYNLILINPNTSVSTAEAYSALKLGLTESQEPLNFTSCRAVGVLEESLSLCGNDFERNYLASYPEQNRIIQRLLETGASIVRMSGSGPTFFGIYALNPGEKLIEKLQAKDWQVYAAVPITLPKVV